MNMSEIKIVKVKMQEPNNLIQINLLSQKNESKIPTLICSDPVESMDG